MLDIKKIILCSLLSLPAYAEDGCVDHTQYAEIIYAKAYPQKATLRVTLRLSDTSLVDIEEKSEKGLLKVLIHNAYIIQDHLQLLEGVCLLEYTGYTQLNILKGKRVLSHKKVDKNTLVLVIKT